MTPQENQDLDTPVFIAHEDEDFGLWRSPVPLQDERVVASLSEGEWEDRAEMPLPFSLWIMHGDGTDKEPLYSDPNMWSLQAVEVVARTPPLVTDGEHDARYPYAIINALDVTLRTDDGQPHPSAGQIQQVRVLRENVRTINQHDQQLDGPGQGAFLAWDDPDTEVIGLAPVREDASFAVVVPTDTPLTWELLDGDGAVIVRERFGTELRAGEVRRCGGCHAPHDGTTGSTSNLALEAPTNLSGQNVDLDGNGVVDLLENLCGAMPEFCNREILSDGFESGDLSGWTTSTGS